MAIDLTVPQTEFFTDNSSEYIAAVAGFGSGKTGAAVVKILSRILAYPTINQAYMAPTYKLISDIFYPQVSQLLTDSNIKFKINKGENVIHIDGAGLIYCRTMDDPDTIVGWECGDIFMDEFDILPTDKAKRVMAKASARARMKYPDKKVNQKHITTTPEGFKATYEYFQKKPLDNSKLIQMSTYSNEHNLPEGYIAGLMSQYPEALQEAYIMGVFTNLQSRSVYYAFDRKVHITHYVEKPREAMHWGMDFNVHDMCAVGHVIRNGKVYAVREMFGLRDTPDMIEAIQEAYPDRKHIIYPDASGKGTSSKSASLSDIKLLKAADKFIVKAKNKNPLIKDRVTCMNVSFERGRYFINLEKCPEYADSIEQQPYNKSTGQPLKDGHVDNRVDGSGYLMNFLFPIVKPVLQEQTLGGF